MDNIPSANVDSLENSLRIRCTSLISKFAKLFGYSPRCIARAPGRVNIIGEHIDYSGYAVLPMAIDRDILIAVGLEKSHDTVTFRNIDPKYEKVEFSAAGSLADTTIQHWGNYLKGPYNSAVELMSSKLLTGFDALVEGTIPAGGGVSSSAAMVCAVVLATCAANNFKITQSDLIKAAIKGEHNAGVQCGGMDQSISVLGEKSHALIINFYPSPSSCRVHIPQSPVFVIANTLVVADKHKTAPRNYNLRVVEVRLASLLLSHFLGINPPVPLTLHAVQHAVFKEDDINKMCEVVERLKETPCLTLAEVAKIVRMDLKTVEKLAVDDIHVEPENGKFKVYSRAKHVVEEARRVIEFRDVCAKNQDDVLKILGRLMVESHESCKNLFECSCDELDELTSICSSLPGCYGSRLTGAGWGGCAVSLVEKQHVEDFISNVKEKYHFKHFPQLKNQPEIMNDIVFSSQPTAGAQLLFV